MKLYWLLLNCFYKMFTMYISHHTWYNSAARLQRLSDTARTWMWQTRSPILPTHDVGTDTGGMCSRQDWQERWQGSEVTRQRYDTTRSTTCSCSRSLPPVLPLIPITVCYSTPRRYYMSYMYRAYTTHRQLQLYTLFMTDTTLSKIVNNRFILFGRDIE